MHRAPGLTPKIADKFVRTLTTHLHPGEQIQVLSAATQFRPILDGIALTDTRIIGFFSPALARKPPAISLPWSDLDHIDYFGTLSGTRIVVVRSDGTAVPLGTVAASDSTFLRKAVEAVRAGRPVPAATPPASPQSRTQNATSARGPAPVRGGMQPVRAAGPRWWTVPHLLAAATALILLLGLGGALVANEHLSSIAIIAGLVVPLVWYGVVTPLRRRRAQRRRHDAPTTSTRTRIALAASSIALLLLGGLTAPQTGNLEPSTTAAAPEQPDPESSGTPSPSAAPAAPDTAAPQFSEDLVRAHGVSKQNKGGQSNIRFVGNSDDPAVLAELTEQCIDHFLVQTAAAYCYAYGSDVDYDHTTFDWTPEFDESSFGGSRPCWVVYGGQPIAGPDSRTLHTASGLDYLTADCPGTVAFPDQDGALAAERQRRATAAAAEATRRHRDACALVDTAALARHGFATTVEATTDDPASVPEGGVRSHSCQSAELELTLTVIEYPTSESAQAATSQALAAPNSFLLEDGGFVTALPGGSALVNEAFGISDAHWSTGVYTVAVTLNSQPPIPGLAIGQTATDLLDTLTALASAANARLTADTW